jgi:hypothetical protein
MPVQLMQIQSFLIVSLMIIGIIKHSKRKTHVKLMSIAMIWDVILILQIELSRGAILKASKAIENALILNIHVSIAVSTVVLYGFMIHSGRKVLVSNASKDKHKKLGYLTFGMRVLTLITSFFAVVE